MCGDDKYVYYFSNDQRSFSAADDECIRRWRGGALARTGLGQLQLCGAENKHYWINFVENNNCEPADTGIYSWRNDKKCRSPNPLRVTRTVTNNNECQALQLSLQSSGSEAIERNCASTAHYICQVPRRVTTPAAITTRKIISSIQTTSTTPTSFFNESVDTVPSDTTDINPGVIAAVIICCILMLMLLVFLYLWRYKKYDLKKLKNFAVTKKPTPTQPAATNFSSQSEDHFYHYVSPLPNSDEDTLSANGYEYISSQPNPSPYQMAQDVTASEYQEIDPAPSTSTQDQPETQNNGNLDGEYSKLDVYQHGVPEANYGGVNAEPNPVQPETTCSSVGTDTVEYTTVRAINEPTQIYAVVHKPGKS